jgi:hypothetical protein
MTYDVPPNLIRVAVGMEPLEVLQTKFETAFSTSRLYPKPKRSAKRMRMLLQVNNRVPIRHQRTQCQE